jgi:cell division protein FtsB
LDGREIISGLHNDKESVKELIIALLNTIEHLVQENAKLREENQQLRDEIASLKGEKGKPKIRPNVPIREPISPKTKSMTQNKIDNFILQNVVYILWKAKWTMDHS